MIEPKLDQYQLLYNIDQLIETGQYPVRYLCERVTSNRGTRYRPANEGYEIK
jgi:hypothetical protein